MAHHSGFPRWTTWRLPILALALAASAGFSCPARAQGPVGFPRIAVWAYPGAYRDSSLIRPNRCVGSFKGPLPDSVAMRPRTITVRFLRDRKAEARSDFGGYRVYRMTDFPDTTSATLIRRFSRNTGDERTWNFSVVDTATLQYKCLGAVVNDSIVTFIDADSVGNFQKVCRVLDRFGRCLSLGDSVIKLVPPPGPHDGRRTWYAVTYEARNRLDNTYEDLYVPGRDNFDNYARCGTPGDTTTCPIINMNHKALNVSNGTPSNPFATPVEPTGGPTANLELVRVVPNPYRAQEVWDQPGAHEVHFINLPSRARIRIYTVSGDLVAEIDHNDPVRDFARWDLKNMNGRDVASGIYMYRVETDQFSMQNRFVVIR
jgi:hypothetical protein